MTSRRGEAARQAPRQIFRGHRSGDQASSAPRWVILPLRACRSSAYVTSVLCHQPACAGQFRAFLAPDPFAYTNAQVLYCTRNKPSASITMVREAKMQQSVHNRGDATDFKPPWADVPPRAYVMHHDLLLRGVPRPHDAGPRGGARALRPRDLIWLLGDCRSTTSTGCSRAGGRPRATATSPSSSRRRPCRTCATG